VSDNNLDIVGLLLYACHVMVWWNWGWKSCGIANWISAEVYV